MKWRINSTGRQRILREHFKFSMLEAEIGQPLKAKVTLDLSSYNFPATAALVIEGYHSSSVQRFECGSVARPAIPSLLVVDEVERSGSLHFRIKVVDTEQTPGLLLGSAVKISPKGDGDRDGRKSLLPVRYRDLGHQVWKVDVEFGNRPELIVNLALPEIKHWLKSHALIQGFMLPAALRIVLQELVRDADGDGDEGDAWREEWKTYCRMELGMTGDPPDMRGDAQQKAEWIENAVDSFCRKFKLVKRIVQDEASWL